MAVMGDASAEVWAEELRRTGRVVFPQRPRALVFKALWLALSCVPAAVSFPDMLAEGGFARVLGLLVAATFIGGVGCLVWQVITGRPVLTVDREGIRFGRRFRPWKEIGAIGIPTGPTPFMTIPLIPNDVWSKHLAVPRDNVKDLPALTTWLTELLKAHRNSTTP